MEKTNNPSVYIILLNWKDYDDTKACLLSFNKVTYPNFKIVVVDNFSNDGSVEKLQSEFPEVTYVLNEGNFGFSRGCNAGMRKAYHLGADYVLVLNNDMVVEPGFLEPAIEEAKKTSKLGAVTGKIMYIDRPDVFWQAGGYIDIWRSQGIPRGKGEIDKGQYDKICETGWASGAMSLIPRSTLETVGYFPEEYFFGHEEWDYSTALLRAGLKIMYVPTFKAFHQAGGSYKAGHPVLNIYGGYMGKMIYAEKYMSPLRWKLWRMAFWFYLKFKWPILAREGCQCEEDYKVKLRAGYMAFEDHKTIKYVGLPELENAALRLGPTPSWGTDWVSS
jgi:GT2 family glycosyltransferase